MSNDEQSAPEPEAELDGEIEAYDLDGDGKVSLIEAERGRLGIIDARLEQLAEHDGITGKLAEAAHKLIDELDND